MTMQHLSDEAIAAFADGVLIGAARTRAGRHTAECPECAHAVAVQREAVWALRSAPAPALPTGLLDRLRSVPADAPLPAAPAALSPEGSPVFASFGAMAAFVPSLPPKPARPTLGRRVWPFGGPAADDQAR